MVGMDVLYKKVYLQSTLQFAGRMEEYFSRHTEDLAVFVVQPRLGQRNLFRRYHRGQLVQEQPVCSSSWLVSYYFRWFFNHIRLLLEHCPRDSKSLVFVSHPVGLFGMRLLKWRRPLVFAYLIGDYFPPDGLIMRAFEFLKRRCQARADFAFYLTDRINAKMNGGAVVASPTRRTVMWGLKPAVRYPSEPTDQFRILFVGVVKPNQGLEALFRFLSRNRAYLLRIVGTAEKGLYHRYTKLLNDLSLDGRVDFSNRSLYGDDFVRAAENCHAGIAMYDVSPGSFTHYADPGKIKTYAELGLPVVMTDISEIAGYVRRFHCGEVIGSEEELGPAFTRIREHYTDYIAGLQRFSAHFDYEPYYRQSFSALQDVWSSQ